MVDVLLISSKNCAFISYQDEIAPVLAIENEQGTMMGNTMIYVEFAREHEPKGRR